GQATLNTDRDRLRTTYARLELLLYLLAAVDDAAVRRRVEAELPEALQDTAGCYAEASAWQPGPIELDRLSPGQYRTRRWRKQLRKWRRGLYSR
ncbi:MAG: hypothetical protein AAF657_41445, partial [Acidobacteriota bacterium]